VQNKLERKTKIIENKRKSSDGEVSLDQFSLLLVEFGLIFLG
jgi:hypothetical protein